MGIETALLIGFTVATAAAGMKDAERQAKATIAEGNIVASNKALEVKRKAAAANVSFLNSGLTLEGTPEMAIQGIYETGLQDINQIRSNYNNSAKNTISAARTKALGQLAGSFAGASFGEIDLGANFADFFGNDIGQTVGGAFDSSPTGPYQPLGGL